MAIQKVDFYGQFRPAGVDTGESRVFQQAANLSATIQDKLTKDMFERAQAEGTQEGLSVQTRDEQGELQAPNLRNDYTIKGQAFDAAAKVAYISEVRRDARENVNRIYNESEDVISFDNRAEAYLKASTSELPEDIRFEVENDLKNTIHTARLKKETEFYNKEMNRNLEIVNSEIEATADDLLTAYNTGDREQGARLRVGLEEVLTRAEQAGLVNATQRGQTLNQLDEEAEKEIYLGDMQRIVDSAIPLGERLKLAENAITEAKKTDFKYLNPRQKESLIANLQTKAGALSAELSKIKAKSDSQLKTRISRLNKEITRTESVLTGGIELNPEYIQGLIEEAENINFQAGDTKIDTLDLERRLQQAQQVQQFSLLPKDQRAQSIKGLEKLENDNKLTTPQAEILKQARDADKDIETLVNKVGIEALQFQGIEEVIPLEAPVTDENGNLDSTAFIDSLQKKNEQAQFASQHYGKSISMLTNDEANGLIKFYASAPPSAKAAVTSQIVKALGEESIPMLAQINDKGGSLIAYTGGMALDGGDPTLIYEGMEILREDKSILPSNQDISLELDSMFEGLYANNTKHRVAVVSSIKAAYAAQSAIDGDYSGVLDTDRLEDVVANVTGGISEWNGGKVELPRGVDEDDFEDWADDEMTFVKALSGAGYSEDEAIQIADAIDSDGILQSIGSGRYMVMIDSNKIYRKDNDAPLILEFPR